MCLIRHPQPIGPVWIVGDSIVRWAAGKMHLPCHVIWKGKSGARIGDLESLLQSIQGPPPSVIIFHIGTNDLTDVDEFCMRQRISVALQRFVVLFPNTKIVWSHFTTGLLFRGQEFTTCYGKETACH